ncbi:unnamed protein product [Ilex paraguariensis]|uniref:Uncharacterized protein n=1 Tax=Ilex paraguariensis TaxID=185542 RepID=A0ABC8S5A9_9AQUA
MGGAVSCGQNFKEKLDSDDSIQILNFGISTWVIHLTADPVLLFCAHHQLLETLLSCEARSLLGTFRVLVASISDKVLLWLSLFWTANLNSDEENSCRSDSCKQSMIQFDV